MTLMFLPWHNICWKCPFGLCTLGPPGFRYQVLFSICMYNLRIFSILIIIIEFFFILIICARACLRFPLSTILIFTLILGSCTISINHHVAPSSIFILLISLSSNFSLLAIINCAHIMNYNPQTTHNVATYGWNTKNTISNNQMTSEAFWNFIFLIFKILFNFS